MCPSEERLSRNVEAGFVEVELVNLRLKNVRHRLGSILVGRSLHRGADLTSAPVRQRGEETGGGGRLLCPHPETL